MQYITVLNIGQLGYGKYNPQNYPKPYTTWKNMLKRCYDEKFHIKQPTYKNCTVAKKWHNFQNFAKWFEENYVEGWQLDKDILFKGNKIYSSKTCCFVPKEVNVLFTKSRKSRGVLLIGVRSKGEKFQSSLSLKDNKCKHLGTFKTELEAFQAYKKAKEVFIKQIAEKYKLQLTSECYKALREYKVEIND